jgi:hypothetical protein
MKVSRPVKRLTQHSTTATINDATAETIATQDLAELSQAELMDKINQQIGVWKEAQERKRVEEQKTAGATVTAPYHRPITSREQGKGKRKRARLHRALRGRGALLPGAD